MTQRRHKTVTGENLMGILDSIVGAAGGGGASGLTPGGGTASAAIVTQVLALLRGQGGATNGLSSLLQAFEGGGLGHIFQSWVGTGQNLPVSPDQIQNVLGNSGLLQRIAQATGMQPGDVAQHLSAVLPQIVDHLTPNGQIHPGDASSALEGLAQRFLHG
jgi:uncharacterized protein YidB (DUF937 family)